MPAPKTPAPKPAATTTSQVHILLACLVAVTTAAAAYNLAANPLALAKPDLELQLLIFLAAANSLTALARQLKWQYVLTAAAFAAAVGSAAQWFGQTSGIPFGPFSFGPNAGFRIIRLPWTVPFIWVIAVFSSRGVARLMLRPWRKTKTYGFWLIGLTAALCMLLDLGLDPLLGDLAHFWLWSPTKIPWTWAAAPLLNFPGWAFVSLLILAFSTPFLIKKKPGDKSGPDYHPLAIWAGALGLAALACGCHGRWLQVGFDGVAIVAAAVMAIRGAIW